MSVSCQPHSLIATVRATSTYLHFTSEHRFQFRKIEFGVLECVTQYVSGVLTPTVEPVVFPRHIDIFQDYLYHLDIDRLFVAGDSNSNIFYLGFVFLKSFSRPDEFCKDRCDSAIRISNHFEICDNRAMESA